MLFSGEGKYGMIRVKRAYEPPAPDDGKRFLVDRFWPRGVRKDQLQLDGWMRKAAPTSELRRWFGHDPAKWVEFQQRYAAELKSNSEMVASLLEAAEGGDVTLVFGAHDTEHNNALALKHYLEAQLKARPSPQKV
jgi:uncharacterized protein YeaO (DUF488 family)